jgi:hypothetical protein
MRPIALVLLTTLTACATPVSVPPEDVARIACEASQHLATITSDDIFDNDWRFLAPLWWTPADPVADAAYCATIIEATGRNPGPVTDPAALCRDAIIVLFDARSDRRVGPMGVLGAAWAVHDAVLERHGIPTKPHSVLPCVAEFYDGVRAELRQVGGV